jgi:hypothetical protein
LVAVNGTYGDQGREDQFSERYSLLSRAAGVCWSGSGDMRDMDWVRDRTSVGGGLTLNGALSPHSLRGLAPGVTHCS